MISIRYTDPERTRGVVTLDDGREVWTVLPPEDGEMLAVYDRFVADGGVVEPYAAPPMAVPQQVSQTQFMRAAVRLKLVTGGEAEAYLATGTLPAFVSGPLDALPPDQRADARLKAIGATDFYRDDALFVVLIAGKAATAAQVDALFELAGSLT